MEADRSLGKLDVELPKGAELAKCRQLMRLCATMAFLADALMEIKRDVVPLAELYDLLSARLVEGKDIATRLLNIMINDLVELDENIGEMRHVVIRGGSPVAVTREGLGQIAINLHTMRSLLGCLI